MTYTESECAEIVPSYLADGDVRVIIKSEPLRMFEIGYVKEFFFYFIFILDIY